MPTEKLDDINVGELLRTGFVLNTGEATALVHAVFSAADKSNPRAFPQTADDLRLTQTGELRISPSAWVSGAADPRIAAAALLHALLPPPSSSDNAVPAPLRGLPDRLRASAAAVNNAKVQDLVAILSRYIAVDPRRVLERLAVRARTSKPRESGRLLSVVSPEPPRGAPPETIVPLSRAEDDALALFGPDAERSARSQLPSADPGIAAPAIPHEQGDRAPESAPEISPIEPEDAVVTPRPRQRSRPARRGPNSERRRSSQPRQARESASEVDPAAADRRVTKRVRRVPKVLSGPPEPDSPAEAASESAPKGSIPVARVRSSKRRASAGRAKGINGSQPTTTASDAVPAPAVGDQQASREHNEQSALVEVPSGVVAGNASPIVQTVVGEPSDLIFETSNGSPPLALEREMDVFRRPTLDTNVPAQSGGDADASRTVRSTGRRAMRIAASVMLLAASGYAGYSYTRWPGATRGHGPASGSATPLNRDVPDNPPPAADTTIAPSPSTAPNPPASSVGSGPQEESGNSADSARPLDLRVADGAFSPSFAPDGRELFFHAGRTTGRLLEADLDDRGNPSNIRPVLAAASGPETSKDYHVRPSPDGRLIAFDSDRDGERGVYVANPDGSNATRVSGRGFAAVPSWSPDMKWLAFVRAEPRRLKVWNLWLRDLASGELRRLTSFSVGQIWGASWFADGTRLCYSHEDRLIVFDVATSASEIFSAPRSGALVRTPAVSPDGQRIVFQLYRDGVWMLDLQTRSMSRILSDATAEEFAWHPDGRSVAYHSGRDGQRQIWVFRPPRS